MSPSPLQTLRRARQVTHELGWKALHGKIARRLLRQDTWSLYTQEAQISARLFDFSPQEAQASQQVHRDNPGALPIHSITWFLPEFRHAYYGGIYTILRLADHLTRTQSVQHSFKILGSLDAAIAAGQIAAAFPALVGMPVESYHRPEQVAAFAPTDAAVATLWGTAYSLLRFNQTRRKFYFLQDYEPLFYPAGTLSAQAEATYRFGFYGLVNTPALGEIYTQQHGGRALAFTPCIDPQVFYPSAQATAQPPTVFFYGRPGHPRNGFELGAQALRLLKRRLGEGVRIVAAGDRWQPRQHDLDGVVENLGVLDYPQTAELYRTCQAGLVLMFTRHPSYLPLELMACGCPVVTNYNPATTWLLRHRQNCLLAEASPTCIAAALEQALLDQPLRQAIRQQALTDIRLSFSDWEGEMQKIFQYMCDPKDNPS